MSEGRAAIFTPQDLCDPVSWQDRGCSLRNWMTYPNGRQPGESHKPTQCEQRLCGMRGLGLLPVEDMEA